MLRKNGNLHEVTWEEAINAFTKSLTSLQKKKKINEVAALISSSAALNEQYFMHNYLKFRFHQPRS
ncbi:MAG: hypothetical protein Ct9H300mP4_11760 [Gammaproteobacteria bacterium]|nr:MAG: hypothetical protein Ct9H300mP4_11760 [Gammaproteobacteria bacterium]